MDLWQISKFEEDEDDEAADQDYWKGKDGIILMVDSTKTMFESLDEESGDRLFDLCLKCADSVMKNKIVAGNKDLMGLVFFGTAKSKNPSEFKNIYIFQGLQQPGADQVMQVQSLIEVPEKKFSKEFGHDDQFSLSDALWTCSTMFSNCNQKLGHKRLLLFTCNDEPHKGSPQLQNQARKRASDLFDVGIEIHLMHLKSPEKSFDVSAFYKDIIQIPDDEATALSKASEKLDELMTRVRRKDNKKRPLSNVPFCLGKGISMSVGFYSLVLPQKKPTAIRLYKENNEIVKTSRKFYDPQTGEVPFPSDIKYSQKHGNKVIAFEKDEISEMKQIGQPGITLLGFKPKSSLKIYHHIRPAHFIYPNESNIQGSTRLFSALLKKCVEREVIAICWITQRRNVIPRLAALVPQEEVLDGNSVQIEPPGFHAIYLPFSEDIRILSAEQEDSPFVNRPTANDEQISKAKDIIKKLQFKFDSESFDNPELQTHFRNIEALALNQDSVEEVADYTAPNNEMISQRAGNLIQEFKDLVFPSGYSSHNASKAKRRMQVAGATKAAVEVDIKEEAKAGRLGKLTVRTLKSFAQKTSISCGTLKAELIEAIMDHFGFTDKS